MTHQTHPFDAYIQQPEDAIRVARAALLFALDKHPGLDVDGYVARLDRLADRVGRLDARDALEQIAAIRTVLIEQEGLIGDLEDYANPANSYLNEVLDRRRGLPISLSVIWVDVARSLDWRFHGIGFPGHFLAACDTEQERLFLDPFRGGALVSLDECISLLREQFGPDAEFEPALLDPCGPRATLTRMLNNLRIAYIEAEQWPDAIRVLRRLSALHPDDGDLTAQLQQVCNIQARLN